MLAEHLSLPGCLLHGCGKKRHLGSACRGMGYPPTEICTSATILCGRRKGKGSAPSRATACITSSQRRSSGSGFSSARRFAVGTVRMMLSVASSPQGPGFSWMRLFHSSWVVSPRREATGLGTGFPKYLKLKHTTGTPGGEPQDHEQHIPPLHPTKPCGCSAVFISWSQSGI